MNDTTPRETPEGADRTEPDVEQQSELELERTAPESTSQEDTTEATASLSTMSPTTSVPTSEPTRLLPQDQNELAPAAPTQAAPTLTAPGGGLVTVRTGPRPGAIVLGLLCLLVSTYTVLRQTLDWRPDLDLLGPISIGAFGALLLIVGLIGMVGRRR